MKVCTDIWCQIFYWHERTSKATTSFSIVFSAIYFNVTHTSAPETHFSIDILEPKCEGCFVVIVFGIDRNKSLHLPSTRLVREEKGKVFGGYFARENILDFEFKLISKEMTVEDAFETRLCIAGSEC